MGLVALQHVGSFWTRAGIYVPCTGRQAGAYPLHHQGSPVTGFLIHLHNSYLNIPIQRCVQDGYKNELSANTNLNSVPQAFI